MSAEQIKEMMENWTKTEAAARVANPSATEDQIYQLTANAMNKSIGL